MVPSSISVVQPMMFPFDWESYPDTDLSWHKYGLPHNFIYVVAVLYKLMTERWFSSLKIIESYRVYWWPFFNLSLFIFFVRRWYTVTQRWTSLSPPCCQLARATSLRSEIHLYQISLVQRTKIIRLLEFHFFPVVLVEGEVRKTTIVNWRTYTLHIAVAVQKNKK